MAKRSAEPQAFAYGMTTDLASRAPAFAEAYTRMVEAVEDDTVLTPAVRHLIGLAVNAAVTHLNREASTAHIEAALRHGASEREVLEVLEYVSCLGIHSLVHGAPRLVAAAPEMTAAPLSPRQRSIKDEFLTHRPYWPEPFDGVLAADPDFFEACSDFQHAPYGGVIEEKVRELIFVAIDASTTHMYANVDRHIRLALELGATPRQVMAALEISALIGVQSYTMGVAALEEAQQRLLNADCSAAAHGSEKSAR